jgi:hypothetical protein
MQGWFNSRRSSNSPFSWTKREKEITVAPSVLFRNSTGSSSISVYNDEHRKKMKFNTHSQSSS